MALLCCGTCLAQERTLTFTSATDAKFFVYLNGKIQNERPTGMLTINKLEDKEYHLRIVIDDPYEVAVTKRIRPDERGSEYTVHFNAVRERVYVKKKKRRNADEEPDEETPAVSEQHSDAAQQPSPKGKHASIRPSQQADSLAGKNINRLKTR